MGARTATFVGAIRETVRLATEGVHVCMPASVQSYDPATQTVTALPLIKNVLIDDDGNERVEDLPPLTSVPVAFPRAGSFLFSMPLAIGDIVLLVFTDRSIDRWRAQGGVVDPGDLRAHNLSDAIAIPGVYPTAQVIPVVDVSLTGPYLGKQGGPGVHVTATVVELGGSVAVPPTDFVALAALVLTRLQQIATAYDAHVHPTGVGPSGVTAAPLGTIASVAATKVKGV